MKNMPGDHSGHSMPGMSDSSMQRVPAHPMKETPVPSKPGAKPGKQQYTCEMHPEVVYDHPGDCPKCGMKLIPKK
jgi:Cu+-exporting ATPase